jgi:hypothetical protein
MLIVFLTTDLISILEKRGQKTIPNYSWIDRLFFLILFLALNIPAAKGIIQVNDAQFTAVLVKVWIIVGSISFFSFTINRCDCFWFSK